MALLLAEPTEKYVPLFHFVFQIEEVDRKANSYFEYFFFKFKSLRHQLTCGLFVTAGSIVGSYAAGRPALCLLTSQWPLRTIIFN